MNVVVVSAHPDDEMIGCGGTLLKHIANNDSVHWIIMTEVLEQYGFSANRVKTRDEEITLIAKSIRTASVFRLGYPTMHLNDTLLVDMTAKIAAIFQKIKPEVIYVVNRSDAHSDHRITFNAIAACTKSFRHPYIKKVLMYECISETEFAPALPEKVFIPNYFVDITNFMQKKMELLQVYQSELGEHPFPRSLRNIEALAVFRGASVGVEYAEAFQLIKYIDK